MADDQPTAPGRAGDSEQLRGLVAQVLLEHPACWLLLPGCTRVATEIDHVLDPIERPDLELEPANLRGACHPCRTRRAAGWGTRPAKATGPMYSAREAPALSIFDEPRP